MHPPLHTFSRYLRCAAVMCNAVSRNRHAI
jgi:hypothetical protein